jgi:hypothetical protein
MVNDNVSLNEEIKVKLTRRNVLLILLCINVTRNHTKGGTLIYDLDCLEEKLGADSPLMMSPAR